MVTHQLQVRCKPVPMYPRPGLYLWLKLVRRRLRHDEEFYSWNGEFWCLFSNKEGCSDRDIPTTKYHPVHDIRSATLHTGRRSRLDWQGPNDRGLFEVTSSGTTSSSSSSSRAFIVSSTVINIYSNHDNKDTIGTSESRKLIDTCSLLHIFNLGIL